jgi:hypothetical protein
VIFGRGAKSDAINAKWGGRMDVRDFTNNGDQELCTRRIPKIIHQVELQTHYWTMIHMADIMTIYPCHHTKIIKLVIEVSGVSWEFKTRPG